jgi:hypothetical protein
VPEGAGRSPLLSFAQTDMAFQGDVLATGNYHGFNLYRLSGGRRRAEPRQLGHLPGRAGRPQHRRQPPHHVGRAEPRAARLRAAGCAGGDVSAERFRGIRIFDISDLTQAAPGGRGADLPRQPHAQRGERAGRDGKIIVYVSGTAGVRSDKEDAGCVADPGSMRVGAVLSIDVIEIPVANPAAARIVDRPRVFGDPATGSISGLWAGGDHGDGTQDTAQTDQCHDITVFPTLKLAAGACSGNGILLDISNPRQAQAHRPGGRSDLRLLALGDLQQ